MHKHVHMSIWIAMLILHLMEGVNTESSILQYVLWDLVSPRVGGVILGFQSRADPTAAQHSLYLEELLPYFRWQINEFFLQQLSYKCKTL
jgi:hypothetical protein